MQLALALLMMLSGTAEAHGLSPSRLEAPSGTEYVSYRFTALNLYKQAQEFDVECFKENIQTKIECRAMPTTFWIPANGHRLVKIQIPTEGKDGVYLACTIQSNPEGLIQTRVCSRFYVGVAAPLPDSSGKRNVTAGSAVSRRSGSNKGS